MQNTHKVARNVIKGVNRDMLPKYQNYQQCEIIHKAPRHSRYLGKVRLNYKKSYFQSTKAWLSSYKVCRQTFKRRGLFRFNFAFIQSWGTRFTLKCGNTFAELFVLLQNAYHAYSDLARCSLGVHIVKGLHKNRISLSWE